MQPMLLENIFQTEVAKALWQHISAPKATSCADPILHKLLMQNDQDENISGFLIGEIRMGAVFLFRNRPFKMMRKLRTRFECMALDSGQMYRFQPSARVEMAPTEAFSSTPIQPIAPLQQLPEGSTFLFQQKTFLLKEKRRTRFVCMEVESGKFYLINQMVMVENI